MRQTINRVDDKLKPVYEKHVDLQTAWKREERFPVKSQTPEVIVFADFLAFIVEKLHTDNNWLIGRLA